MGTEINIGRVLKYPPECFMSATPVDLQAGENKVAEYADLRPYVVSIQNLSFSRYSGMEFRLDVDGVSDVIKLSNLAGAKGLDYEENVKVPATKRATFKLISPSAVTAYQWRHKIVVFKPTVYLKTLLGVPYTGREPELAKKYNLEQEVRLRTPEPFNLFEGITDRKTIMTQLSSSGLVLRLPVPDGKKAILTGISAERPAGAGRAYVTVKRDGVEETLRLDLYCLPSLSYDAPIRVVALSELEVELDVLVSGTYTVRLDYGVGRLTLPEKCAWIPDQLTPEERKEAEEKDIFEKLEVGKVI